MKLFIKEKEGGDAEKGRTKRKMEAEKEGEREEREQANRPTRKYYRYRLDTTIPLIHEGLAPRTLLGHQHQ